MSADHTGLYIVIAVHHYPPRYASGAELRAHRTAKALQAAGHTVRVVCVEHIDADPADGLTWQDDEFEGVPVHRLSFNLATAPDPLRWSFDNPWIGEHLRAWLNAERPDIVHLISGYLMSASTLQVARELGIPRVVTLTDFWFLCPRITLVRSDGRVCDTPAQPEACAVCLREERRRYRLLDRASGGLLGKALARYWQQRQDSLWRTLVDRVAVLRAELGRADALIAPSQFLRELYTAQGFAPQSAAPQSAAPQSAAPQRFIYMRQGLDVDDWAAAPQPGGDGHLRIGYIGQFARHKGVEVLVRAFTQLVPRGERSAELLLYGDLERFPSETRRLQALIAGRPGIRLAGSFPHAEIRRIHAGLDVLVVPSQWYENSPNVILEAFACGTPIVVSRLGGMAELVEDGVSGFQFTPGSVHELATVLQRLLDRPDLLERLRAGVPAVKTVRQESAELVALYARLLDESRSAAEGG